jgi:glycosyltransferase involved in cell wall biosynthesis
VRLGGGVTPAPRQLRLVVARYGVDIVGGAERLTRLLAEALRKRGWDVSVLTTRALDERTWADVLPAGRQVEDDVAVERHGVRMRRRPAAFRQMSRVFWRLPARLRPETLWLTLQGPWSPGLEAALRADPDRPTLFVGYLYRPTIAGTSIVRGPRLLLPTAHDEQPLRLRALGAAIGRVDGLLYATQEEQTIVETAHPGAVRVPSEIGNVGIEAPDGVESDRFRRLLGSDAPYLLYGGRATPGKGLEELLEGWRILHSRDSRPLLVLTGDAGSRVSEADGIRPVGLLDETARWEAIAGAAAVVVPSFHESLSLLALEAWATGRPALLNAASPVLQGQAKRSGGALTYCGAAELAARAAELLGDDALCDRLGAAGKAHVASTYTWDAVEARLIRLLDAAGARQS